MRKTTLPPDGMSDAATTATTEPEADATSEIVVELFTTRAAIPAIPALVMPCQITAPTC